MIGRADAAIPEFSRQSTARSVVAQDSYPRRRQNDLQTHVRTDFIHEEMSVLEKCVTWSISEMDPAPRAAVDLVRMQNAVEVEVEDMQFQLRSACQLRAVLIAAALQTQVRVDSNLRRAPEFAERSHVGHRRASHAAIPSVSAGLKAGRRLPDAGIPAHAHA